MDHTLMELQTKRLLLRPFRAEDAPAFEAFANGAGYRQFLGNNHPDAATLVSNNLAIDWERELSWVVCLDGEVVGSIFLGIQKEDGVAELACLLSPDVWGRGIAGEAGRAVVDYAFGELGLHKVFARAQGENAASRGAMEKAGWKLEGVLREHRSDVSGNRVDEVIYGMTRAEWQAARRDT